MLGALDIPAKALEHAQVQECVGILVIECEGAVELLLSAQRSSGGWGPFVTSAPEPFDTALAVLALRTFASRPEVAAAVQRGRRFLAVDQEPDGSWIETTRPAGYESLAQRVSTAAWATQALLLTDCR